MFLFVSHGFEIAPVLVVLRSERPSELSWRARHGGKKTRAMIVNKDNLILREIPMHLGVPRNYLLVGNPVISVPSRSVGFAFSMIFMFVIGAPAPGWYNRIAIEVGSWIAGWFWEQSAYSCLAVPFGRTKTVFTA